MDKKPVTVKIDSTLHDRAKSRGALLRIGVEGAYEEALRKWLGDAEVVGPSQLSTKERDLCARLIALLRSEDKSVKDIVEIALKNQPLSVNSPIVGSAKNAETPGSGNQRNVVPRHRKPV